LSTITISQFAQKKKEKEEEEEEEEKAAYSKVVE